MSGVSRYTRWRVSDLVLDTKRQRVWRGSQEIPLPKLTYDLFATLVRRCAELASDEQLMEDVWPGLVVSPETVSQRVKLLREALGDDSRMPRYIGRLRGRGYHLVPTAEPLDDEVGNGLPVSSPSLPAAEPLARPAAVFGENANRSGEELTLLEPVSEERCAAKPDWASTHVIPNQLFVDLLALPAPERQSRSNESTQRNTAATPMHRTRKA